MPLTKLQFKPGINNESTAYSNEGGWYDCNLIRFHLGNPEKFGGWEKMSSSTYLGTARRLHNWVALDGSDFMGVGTHLKYYIEEGGAFNDVTPIRTTHSTTASDNCIDTTNGSTTVNINITTHGCFANDFVTISGATAVGGVPASDLNKEHQVTNIVDGDNFEIVVATPATSTVSGGGGTSIDVACQINVGLDTTVGGPGWGAGTWGRSTWGSAAPNGVTTTNELRLWSHDNFGEDLLINPRDSGIFYWDKSNGITSRAVNITSLSGSNNAPTIAKQVLVSDIDRHIVAFGCNPQGSSTQDNLLIRFSSQESLTDWEARSDNTAGDLRLGSGSTFVQAIETKREILVWTDKSLHSLRFIGAPFTFGIQQLATNITIMGPEAAIATEDFVFWMGNDNFYVYAGQTTQLPCPVRDKVFLDFNFAEKDKVVCGVNSQWGEVIWFYPSASASENDSYVVYNYLEKIWYFGSMSRTAWQDRGVRQYPIAASGGYLYNHEKGNDDDGSAMNSFIESADMDIGDGDQFVLTRRIIPDLKFSGSTGSQPTVDFTIKTKNYPGANVAHTGTGVVTRTATTPIEQWTNEVDVRLRGRSFAFRVESNTTGVKWELGAPRVDIRPDGRR